MSLAERSLEFGEPGVPKLPGVILAAGITTAVAGVAVAAALVAGPARFIPGGPLPRQHRERARALGAP